MVRIFKGDDNEEFPIQHKIGVKLFSGVFFDVCNVIISRGNIDM